MSLRPIRLFFTLTLVLVTILGGCQSSALKPWQWSPLSEKISEAGRVGGLTHAAFCQAVEFVCRQIEKDRSGEFTPFEFWGLSHNRDVGRPQELAVEPAVLTRIFAEAGVSPIDPGFQAAHAGLLHTYGDLFSVLMTPQGYPRDRWLSGDLERGLMIEPTTLGPEPRQGTLLTNATYFAGRIAFRDSPARLASLRRLENQIPSAWPKLDFSKYSVVTLSERVEGAFRNPVVIHTDLVKFPQPPRSAGDAAYALIYSVKESSKGAPSLITFFGIREEIFRTLTETSSLGGSRTVGARYQSVILGLREPQSGIRELKTDGRFE